MKESKTLWIVEEQRLNSSGDVIQSWIEEYEHKTEALYNARLTWDHLTRIECNKTLVIVYQDIITRFDDGGENRLSWDEGYNPIVTYRQLSREEFIDQLASLIIEYYPHWDIEDGLLDAVKQDPEGNLYSFMIDIEYHMEENPEDEEANAILEKVYLLKASYIEKQAAYTEAIMLK